MKTNSISTLVVSAANVNTIISNYGVDNIMDQLTERLNRAIHSYNPSTTEIPIRSGFNYQGDLPGLVEFMPVHRKTDSVVLKVVGYHPKNPSAFNLPTILSSVTSYDTTTGHLKCIMDGVLLTALRTGAASAIASKSLAKPDSTILGLIGCGAQSVVQLHALSRYFSIDEVLLYDTDFTALETFKERIEFMGLKVDVVIAPIDKIVKSSDIICTATSIDPGKGPLFGEIDKQSHLHINAVGSDFPGKIELPLSLLKKATVVPDFPEQAKIEGECQQLSESEIGPSFSELIKNANKYQHLKDELTVFDSTGWALEDQVTQELIQELALEMGVGEEIEIENGAGDVKNPYHFLAEKIMSK